jgi:hypothetical protein
MPHLADRNKAGDPRVGALARARAAT